MRFEPQTLSLSPPHSLAPPHLPSAQALSTPFTGQEQGLNWSDPGRCDGEHLSLILYFFAHHPGSPWREQPALESVSVVQGGDRLVSLQIWRGSGAFLEGCVYL